MSEEKDIKKEVKRLEKSENKLPDLDKLQKAIDEKVFSKMKEEPPFSKHTRIRW